MLSQNGRKACCYDHLNYEKPKSLPQGEAQKAPHEKGAWPDTADANMIKNGLTSDHRLGQSRYLSYSSTIWAIRKAACINTSVPAPAHSLVISSASLWLSPPTQGHIIIAVGAISLIQHAS